jgi:hypothetical protein
MDIVMNRDFAEDLPEGTLLLDVQAVKKMGVV